MTSSKSDTDTLLDALVKGKTPQEILGENGLVKQLTKRLVERVLEAEMTDIWGQMKNFLAAKLAL